MTTEPGMASGAATKADRALPGAHIPTEPPAVGDVSAITGDARVDAATGGVDGLDELPLGEHVERFATVHTQLQDILNDIDIDIDTTKPQAD